MLKFAERGDFGDDNVEEVNDYYPFGGLMSSATTNGFQPYKYNGKELDREAGLDLYDYGKRFYDPAIGRWHVADPMAEKYYASSLYNYCDNEPIGRIDFGGMDYWTTNDPEEIRSAFNALKNGNDSVLINFNNSASWTHVSDEEILRNLESGPTGNLYSSYASVQNGQIVITGISFPNLIPKTFSKDSQLYSFIRANSPASGRLESIYPEFDFIMLGRGIVNAFSKVAKNIFNFGTTPAKHMSRQERAVPIQILQQAIKNSKGLPDPKGSRALMHTIPMWKNGKLYKLEVLYDKKTNTIWHFKYEPFK